MIEVEVNGSIYQGRFVHMDAKENFYRDAEGVTYYKNIGYLLQIMDANGVRLNFELDSLNQITILG